MIKQFTVWVDEVLNTLDLSKQNIDSIATRIGAETPDVRSISEKVYSLIPSLLKSEELTKLKTQTLNLWKDEFYLRHLLNMENTGAYINILEIIVDSWQGITVFAKTDEKDWKKAIELALLYRKINPDDPLNAKHLPILKKKLIDKAESFKKMVGFGCMIVRSNGFTHLSGEENVAKKIEEKVKALGGITVFRFVVTILKDRSYNKTFDRFNLTRHHTTMGTAEPQIPFGYIFQLCVKHPVSQDITKELEGQISDTIQLAKVFVNSCYNVQEYSPWSFLFANEVTIQDSIQKTALWDTLFTIFQVRPQTAFKIVQKLFSFIPAEEFKSRLQQSYDVFLRVIKTIFSFAQNTIEPINFSALDVVVENPDLTLDKVETVLDFLSHFDSANNAFNSPTDYVDVDFTNKPLIKLDNLYLFIQRSWCSFSFYEALAGPFWQKKWKHFDNEMGKAIEELLSTEFSNYGITTNTGEYSVGEVDGESDLVVETDTHIFLIECKRKPITRKARAGQSISIFIDLIDSFMASQYQAGKIELILLQQGYVDLNKNGIIYRLELKKREVERISVSLHEYGGFQDRSTIKIFLQALLTRRFDDHSIDPEIIKKLRKLEADRVNWVQQYDDIVAIDNEFADNPFFNSWFLSLSQIMEVIRMCRGNNDFGQKMRSTKFLSYSTMDFYKEFAIANSLE
jgi:hypothetical protein